MSMCNYCYSPRVDETSLKHEDNLYCSLECFYNDMSRYKCESTREELEDNISNLESQIESLEEENSELDNRLDEYGEYKGNVNKASILLDQLAENITKIQELLED